MNSEDAIGAITAGRAILFAGAGFSFDAKCGDQSLPGGSALSKQLMAALGSDEATDYTLAAELFSAERGEPALSDFLRKTLTTSEVSDAQILISRQPWRRLYTTNFDDVLEYSIKRAGRSFISLTPKDPPPAVSTTTATIVHLHGFIGEASTSQHGIDLARSKLMRPSLQRTAWPTQIQVDIESSDAVFIVGYSLSDFHIAQLLRTTNAIKRKTFLVLEEKPSLALSAYLSRFGTVLPIGLKEFSRRISESAAEDIVKYAPSQITCFERFALPEHAKTPTTEDTFSLLLNGFFDDSAYMGSRLVGAPPYALTRRRAATLATPSAEQPITVVLQSRIGNGKSLCLREMQHELSINGAAVWVAKHPLPAIYAELDTIRQSQQRRAFIFDTTDGFESAIQNVHQALTAGDVLIVCTRLADAQSDSSPVKRMLPGGYLRYDLNALSEEEIPRLESWVSYYGLWGDVAGNSPAARIRYIRDQCGKEMRSVIISLFQHGSLEERIRQGLRDIEGSERDVRVAFAALLVARFAGCPLDFFDLCELVDVEPYATRESLSMVGGGEFVEITTGDFDIRSPVLAEFLLSRCLSPQTAFDAITTMIDVLTGFVGADWRYEESLPLLMKYSIIAKIFPDSERREFIVPFYEHLLRHRVVKTNPHYWLQFAMARMERGEFDIVQKCLENAYIEARKRGPTYKTYMLDNQKIKFLLKSRSKSGNYTDKSQAFAESIKLFGDQIKNIRAGVDVHVLRLIDPLIQYREQFSGELSRELKDHLSKELIELRRRVNLVGGNEAATSEEQRLIALLPRSDH